MRVERGLHDAALHAAPAAVNQPDFAQSRIVGRCDVLLDDRPDVAWMEGVKVDRVLDRDAMHFIDVSWGPTPRPASARYARAGGLADRLLSEPLGGGFDFIASPSPLYHPPPKAAAPPPRRASGLSQECLGPHPQAR